MTKRVEADLTSTWTYDTAAHGVGSLAEATTGGGYSRTMTYDALGRASSAAISFAGNNASYTTTYDSVSGKVATVTYPSGLVLRYIYNSYGYLSQEKDNSSGVAYWTASARDQFLHVVSETAGNGVTTTRSFDAATGRVISIAAGASNAVANFSYTFDRVGSLTQRVDADLSRTDNFTYDSLNRLSTYSLAGGAYQTMGYDALGDITSKPGVGTYAYPSVGQPHPHAISAVTGSVRGVVNPSFTYDADGNMLSGPGTSITYTSFDMPQTVNATSTWGGFNWGAPNDWLGNTLTLSYDPEHKRVEMGSLSGSTFYFDDPISGAQSELYTPVSGPAQWRSYISIDGRLVAEQAVAVSGGTTTTQYFVDDHLGSIAVVEDASGNVLQRLLYDPWGQQLAQTGASLCATGADTTRGYTGEEQMSAACLVNLNARVYDPILGAFLSADPVSGNVFDQRMLNPYNYVQNNPLSLTDPKGSCGPLCIFFIVAWTDLIVSEVLKPVLERNPILGDLSIIVEGFACGPVCAAEDAGIIAGVTSGSVAKGLEAFVLTLAQNSAFAAIGASLPPPSASWGTVGAYATGFIEAGLVGGTASMLGGGKFGSGFLAAGVTELAGPFIAANASSNRALGTVEAAVVGGTASLVGGGKFANGAITGAFAYAEEICVQGGCNIGSRTVDPRLLGNDIDVTVPNTPEGPALLSKVEGALEDINQASLTPEQIDIIQDVTSIDVSDSITRSYVDEASGTFYLRAYEVEEDTVPFLASDIAHDAFHIDEFLEGGVAESRGIQAELGAFRFQIEVGPALGLSQWELNYLKSYIENPGSYLQYLNQKP